MIDDVDETLRDLLVEDVPIERAEIDISFERPTRDWSSRISKPTLNLFLFDIRERVDFRDDTWKVTRMVNGRAVQERGPRRVDLSYMVTAWTKEPDDEHRILAVVLACMYRQTKLDPTILHGDLAESELPVLTRAMPPDYLMKPADYWGVVNNDIHASLTWVITAPLVAFRPFSGPIVRTRELSLTDFARNIDQGSIQIAGVAYSGGADQGGIAGARVRVAGTTFEALTDGGGRFTFAGVGRGDHLLHVETADGRTAERKVTVPSDGYDVEVPDLKTPATPAAAPLPRSPRRPARGPSSNP